MHSLNIPGRVIDRVISRRGKLHLVDALNPRRTAFLIIDMQNAYLDKAQPGFSPNGVDIIPSVNALAMAFRHAGGQVIWIRNTGSGPNDHPWPTYGELRTPEARERMAGALARGGEGHAISAQMAVEPGDAVFDKYRYSAFIQGSSDLEPHLRQEGIDTLIVGGVLTNVCCESTARDAMMLNFRVVMAAEATAAHTDEEYNGSLASLLFAFGDVMTNAEIEALLPAAVRAKAANA
jgi:ureidoacrylate peracid hydrolase